MELEQKANEWSLEHQEGFCTHSMKVAAFKAGALWMAKQHANEISECTEKSFNEGVKYAVDKAVEWLSTSKMLVESGIVDKFKEAMNETKCTGCNNIKGCVTCTDGDQYAHITEIK